MRRWLRVLVGRAALGVVTVWALLTVAFALVEFTPDPPEGFTTTLPPAPDEPALARYLEWLVGYATLDWGQTAAGRAVTGVVADRLAVTLTYVLPALALALVGGVALGLFAALRRGSLADGAVSLGAVLGFAVPAYFLGQVALVVAVGRLHWYTVRYRTELGPLDPANLLRLSLPATVLAVGLLAVQVRHVRGETIDRLPTERIKLVRAKGGGSLAVARHVLRQILPTVLALFLADALAVFVLTVYVVETIFDVPGFGALALAAIRDRDVALVLATTFVPAAVGVAATAAQDVLRAALDPRTDG